MRRQDMQPAIFDDLEPDACEYCDERNPPNQMFQASIAISLKRIADALWGNAGGLDGATTGIVQLLNGIEQNGRRYS